MYYNEIDTPALIIDLDIMEKNIKNMSNYIVKTGTKLRPHAKNVRSSNIINKQLSLPGATGVAVAKLSEAETMFEGGIDNILIANQIVEKNKIGRLISLAKKAYITILIDNLDNAKQISYEAEKKNIILDVLIEVNIGVDRCGVEPGKPTLNFANELKKLNGIKLIGIQAYEGGLYSLPKFIDRKTEALKRMKLAIDTKKLLENNGFHLPVLSGGGTSTYNITSEIPEVTEIQPGAYSLMDVTHQSMEGTELFDCAVFVLTSIMSTPNPEYAICDLGHKSIGYWWGMGGETKPKIKNGNNVELQTLNEEHAKIGISYSKQKLLLGDKLSVIPGQLSSTMNLYDKVYCIRKNEIENILTLDARGKSQ